MIIIYTDGSSRGNPGPGGYGTVLKYNEHRKELSQGFRKTTNNRMELLAVIEGLEAIKVDASEVTVFSDSKYVVDAVEKNWISGWERTNFKKKKNRDLWERFIPLYKKHKVTLKWVKGHAGIPENERCDELAVGASKLENLLIDEPFEAGINDFD